MENCLRFGLSFYGGRSKSDALNTETISFNLLYPIALVVYFAVLDEPSVLFGESGEVLSMGALVLILSLVTPTSHSLLKRITNATMYVVLILTILGSSIWRE